MGNTGLNAEVAESAEAANLLTGADLPKLHPVGRVSIVDFKGESF